MEGLDPSKISKDSQLPKKGKYRQRAHCNPLTEGGFTPPLKPSDVDWEKDFPELYQQARDRNEPPPKVDFLDIGCGFGGMTICLAEQFPVRLCCSPGRCSPVPAPLHQGFRRYQLTHSLARVVL